MMGGNGVLWGEVGANNKNCGASVDWFGFPIFPIFNHFQPFSTIFNHFHWELPPMHPPHSLVANQNHVFWPSQPQKQGGTTTTGHDATPPQLSVKTWGGGVLGGAVGGGRLEGLGGGGRLEGLGGSAGGSWGGGLAVGGGIPKVGGAYVRPTTTTCIPLGGRCVWGWFGEAAGGCCEAEAADW